MKHYFTLLIKSNLTLLVILLLPVLSGCKTKERIITQYEAVKDSIQVLEMKKKLENSIKENSNLRSEVKTWQEKSYELSERLNTIYAEREQTLTNENKNIKEYSQDGILIREENHLKSSEILKDISAVQERNTELLIKNKELSEQNRILNINYNYLLEQNETLIQKLDLKIKEKINIKTSKKLGIWLYFIVFFAVGAAIGFFVIPKRKLVLTFVTSFLKRFK